MLVKRPLYYGALRQAEGTPDIKALTGIRRCGKSTLLKMFADDTLEREPETNLIRIDLSVIDFEFLLEYHALHDYVQKARVPGVRNMVIIDEVQLCPDFVRALTSLHTSGQFDMYITGSNDFFAGNRLATLLTGRTFPISIWPFSLSEFMTYHQIPDAGAGLARYLTEGGMPGAYEYRSAEAQAVYLRSVWNTILQKDIVQTRGVRSAELLTRVTDFLIDNISNITNASAIAKVFGQKQLQANHKTIGSYLEFLEEAFAFCKVRRYDTVGKRYLTHGSKYYLTDHSFRRALLGTRSPDTGRMFENIVAIELMRRGYRVYAGTLRDWEIDFIAERAGERLYVQVSDDISAPQTLERELKVLRGARDNWPRLLLANTHLPEFTQDGVRVMDLAEWLLNAK